MHGEGPLQEEAPGNWPWPHEWVFLMFLVVASSWLCWTAEFPNLTSFLFLGFLLGAMALVFTSRPTPLRWRIRLLGFAGICGGVYLAFRWAVPLMHDADYLQATQNYLKATDGAITLGTFFPGSANGPWWLSDMFTVFYFFFFYYLVMGPLHYYFHNLRQFRECIVGVLVAYGLGFFGYMFAPANGPFVWMGERVGGPVWDAGNWFVTTNSNGFDAFPSLHFAATFFLLWFDLRHYKRRFWMLLTPTVGLWVATVYLRYHYVVDLLAGLVVAWIAIVVTAHFQRVRGGDVLVGADGWIPETRTYHDE